MSLKLKYELIVIGAGGTGTYFLKEISRFLSGDLVKAFSGFHIFDGDVVERKNLARQCFCEEDIGRHKAAVMAEILEASFGIPYKAHSHYLLHVEELEKCITTNMYGVLNIPVIVGCVDNHACRLIMEAYFNKSTNCILFDSGNEYSSGEVVYSYKREGEVYGPTRSHYFPDVKEGDLRNREEMSCEELNNVAPQHIFTNMMAGNLLCSAVANLLEEKITPGFAYYNSLGYDCGFMPYTVTRQQEST